MNWTYKNIVIEVNPENGRFEFTVCGNFEDSNSLENAKHRIDQLTKDYYTFKKKDINKLMGKLDKREKEFVSNMIEELQNHRGNAYCEMGWIDMKFDIED